jgi:hypothetical protein
VVQLSTDRNNDHAAIYTVRNAIAIECGKIFSVTITIIAKMATLADR